MRRQGLRSALLNGLYALHWAAAGAAVPIVYSQPDFESPVQGDPDDLLLLPGAGLSRDDVVVYSALADSTRPPPHPRAVPSESTALSGVAAVVGAASAPHALTVKLPQAMRTNQSYVLWVRTPAGEWSAPIKINDARPLWVTPAFGYVSGKTGPLPRAIKLVGRNLQPAVAQATQVRLVGPETRVLRAEIGVDEGSNVDRYVARIQLPELLRAGSYRVDVSRDGRSWVALPSQRFVVRPVPPRLAEYSPGETRFGGCRADDDRDDSACIARAIGAASAGGGGLIRFGAGTWILADPAASIADDEGIVIPNGVELRGAALAGSTGEDLPTIVRTERWLGSTARPAFTLLGRNRIAGLRLRDSKHFRSADWAGPFLQLGHNSERLEARMAAAQRVVEDIVIDHNVFDRTWSALGDGGLPIRRLIVAYNEFGAYRSALELTGNRYNVVDGFRIEDSVVEHNSFKPGAYIDVAIQQGALASELGASHRLDFSDNDADGAATEYLDPEADANGWRAGFFFHLTGNHEMTLVSDNTLSCTGDKDGDGEAIAFDNNVNTFAFGDMAAVRRASADTVTVRGALIGRQNARDVQVADFYRSHWVQIGAGAGRGQVRRIVTYTIDPAAHEVSFKVEPRWDVIPDPASTQISVGRQYWQVYAVGNRIDHRRPLCRKSNRTGRKGGGIALWGQMADSVVAANRQYDSDGIVFQQSFTAGDPACKDCSLVAFFQSFIEIRNNLIDGEYDWDAGCSASGITGSHSAAPSRPPPTLGFGVSIAHNAIRRADGLRGGAISMPLTWFDGPPPHRWHVIEGTLIHHNTLSDLWGAAPRAECGGMSSTRRVGINLRSADLVWGSVLYANVCDRVAEALLGGGGATVTICPGAVQDCGCPPTAPVTVK